MASSLGRWPRRLLLAVAGIVLALTGLLLLLQVPPVATWVGRQLAGLAPLAPGSRLDVGGVSGSWVRSLALHDVVLSREGRPLATIRTVRTRYHLPHLLGADRRLEELIVDGARIHTRRVNGAWDIAQAFRTSDDTTAGGSFAIGRLVLRDATVLAELAPDSIARIERLELRARELALGDPPVAVIDTLSARVSPPTDPPVWMSLLARGEATPEVFRLDPVRLTGERSRIAGRLVVPRRLDDARVVDRLDIRLDAAPLALADVGPLVPALAADGELELTLRATAEGRRAVGRLSGRAAGAPIALEGVTLLGSDTAFEYRLRGEVRDLDPSRLATAAPEGRVNADLAVDLRGPALDRADGRVELRLTRSRISGTDLRELGLRGDVARGRADLDFRGAIQDGHIVASGWARPFDSVPSYRLVGSAVGLPGTDSLVRVLAGREGDPRLEIGFRFAGSGTSAEQARVSGRATLTAVRAGGERSRLGATTLELAERRLALRPELLMGGGRVAARLDARLDDPVTYQLRDGVIERVDLGRLLEDTVVAPINGRFALTGRGTSPEEVTVRARLALDEVRYGTRRLERMTTRLALDAGRARLTLRGGIQGGILAVDADALPFDSARAFTVRRAALQRVDLGTLLGRPGLAGPFTARLSGSGRWGEAGRAFRGRLAIDPSTLGTIEVRRGDLGLALDGGRLDYDASLVSSAGALVLSGDAHPLDEVPGFTLRRGRADSLDLGALLGREGLATRLDARLTGRLTGTAPGTMRARLDLELLPSRINRAELRGGRAELALERGELRGDVRVDGADGDLVAVLRGNVREPVRRLRVEGALRADRLARWTGDTAHDGRLAGRFTVDGAADSLGLLTLAGTLTASGALDSVRVDTVQVALSPDTRAVRVDTVVIRSNVAAIDGGGRLALGGEAGADTLRLAGVLRDPMPLAALAGADTLSLDSARVGLTLTGGAARRRLYAEGVAHRMLYAGNQVERLDFRAVADLDSTGVDGAAADLRLGGGAVGTMVVHDALVTGRYDSVFGVRANALLRDDIVLATAVRGAVTGDTVQGTLERLDLSEGGRRWVLERPARFVLRPPRYEIDHLALRAGESRLAVDGVLDRGGINDLAAELRGFELGFLRELGLVPLDGRVDARARLTGPAGDPSLSAELLAAVRGEGGPDHGRVEGKLEWTGSGLALELAAAQPNGRRLTATGTLPLRLTLAPADTAAAVGVTRSAGDTLGVVVRADSFDLAFFEPFLPVGTAERLSGVLAVDGRVFGTMEEPRADGAVTLRGFAATLPAVGVRYEKGELLGRLTGGRFALERLRLVTDNDGELTASGELRLAPLDDPGLGLDAELREFRVSHTATLRTIASGRLRLEGTLSRPVMTGDLRLGRTDIIVGTETAAGANVEEVELTEEDLLRLAREFGPAVLARAHQGPGLVDRFRLDLDVRMPRRVWFRQRGTMKSDIEIFGRVRVRQEPGGKMGFFGQVEPVPGRGSLELYGREFTIQEGEIRLAGTPDNVELDVTAQYVVPTQADAGDEGILIDVNATGTPDSLTLAFTSEPSMTEDDIVSYIVTGRPSSENPLAREETGEGPGAAEAGAEVALGRLSESVAGAAGEALGFDVFQIRQDGLRGLTLTAGRYVASRLFLSLQQPIQLSSDARHSPGTVLGPGFELEYTARRWLRANLRGGNLPPRFFLRGRHAF